jgi:DNA-binding transcriptional regulator YiaG
MPRSGSNMTHTQFEAARNKLGLTQAQVGRLVDVEPRTVRRWAAGEQPVPVGVAMIMRLLIKHNISPDEAYKLATGEKF